jgi:hypothetical protein
MLVDLWSITQTGNGSAGMPGKFHAGSNAYPGMTTRGIQVGDREVLTDGEGYLVDPCDWSDCCAPRASTETMRPVKAKSDAAPHQPLAAKREPLAVRSRLSGKRLRAPVASRVSRSSAEQRR